MEGTSCSCLTFCLAAQLKISFSVHRDLNVKGQNDKSMDYTLAQQPVGAPPMAFPPGPGAPPMAGAMPAGPPAPANGAPFGRHCMLCWLLA